ncbi:MAG: glycosyltransferase family 2 protein [Muribaculaceae bacterium]|nr:glycosyltransferase family 2 protein [Muribaculaceae bacterium]
MKKTAVIILNWNGARLLREYLPSVIAGTDPEVADVIVADNGSTDDSLKVLETEFPQVKLIRFEQNYGFAEGYNKALAATRYPYTVLLNSDVAVRPGWINALVDAMDADERLGACQPKILSRKEPDRFEYAGACGGFIDRNGYPYCRGRIFETCERDEGQYDSPIDIFWASGAAMMVRTEVYLKLGGLDPGFFAHMEEIDLCWRMLTDGWRIVVVPSSVVEHLGGGSLPAGNPRKTYLNFRNNLLMLHKNLPDKSRGRTLFRRRLLDALAWVRFVAGLDFANAAAILKAHRDFKRMRKAYTTHPQHDILAQRPDCRVNILTEYYVRRRKKFCELTKQK